MRRDVRIVLVGDEDSGKSSLITSLIKESFVDRVQPVLPEISLPPEVAPEGVLTKIIDTSCEYSRVAKGEMDMLSYRSEIITFSISDGKWTNVLWVEGSQSDREDSGDREEIEKEERLPSHLHPFFPSSAFGSGSKNS